jgi:MarR family
MSTDLECLDVISLRGPVAAGELAAAIGLTTGAVTGVIDRLERSGFARDANPTKEIGAKSACGRYRRLSAISPPCSRPCSAQSVPRLPAMVRTSLRYS